MAKKESEETKPDASASGEEKKTTRRSRSTSRRTKSTTKATSKEGEAAPAAEKEAKPVEEPKAQAAKPAEPAKEEEQKERPDKPQQVFDAGTKRAQEALHRAGETAKHLQEEMKEHIPEVKERTRKGFESSSRVAGKALGATAEGAGKFFKGAARTTKHTVSILGVELRKSAARREINGLYRKIGERYYELHLTGGIGPEDDPQIKEMLAAIDSLNAEISDLDARQNR